MRNLVLEAPCKFIVTSWTPVIFDSKTKRTISVSGINLHLVKEAEIRIRQLEVKVAIKAISNSSLELDFSELKDNNAAFSILLLGKDEDGWQPVGPLVVTP